MNPDLQQLTLVFPDELETAVLDALGDFAPDQPFTLLLLPILYRRFGVPEVRP